MRPPRWAGWASPGRQLAWFVDALVLIAQHDVARQKSQVDGLRAGHDLADDNPSTVGKVRRLLGTRSSPALAWRSNGARVLPAGLGPCELASDIAMSHPVPQRGPEAGLATAPQDGQRFEFFSSPSSFEATVHCRLRSDTSNASPGCQSPRKIGRATCQIAGCRFAGALNRQQRAIQLGESRGQIVEGNRLAGAVAHLLPERQGLLVVAQRLGLVPQGRVREADVVEGSGLTGAVAHLLLKRQGLLVVAQRFGLVALRPRIGGRCY